jgi:hypothetical protein
MSKQKRRYPTRSSGGDNQYEPPEGSSSTTTKRRYSGVQPAEGSGEGGKTSFKYI